MAESLLLNGWTILTKIKGADMHKFFLSAAVALGLMASSAVADESPVIGVVNFATCITESKAGKKEQENMESMRKQMSALIEDTEKELREIAAKFEDSEYLDSLSPKAEEDLKVRFQTLQEDLSRYQNQFYQVLNHANYQMIQKMSTTIAKAAEKVAGQRKLDYVMNKEACFYIRSDLDVTTVVINEMDKNYELEMKAQKLSDNAEDLKMHALEETAKAG
jgi:outer membrane protein